MKDTSDMRLDLLLFSVGGVYFGVDVEQVAEIAVYEDEQAEDLFWFHEEMGFKSNAVKYQSPTIVTIKAHVSQSFRLIIDSMEDIAEFSQNDIRLFPNLMGPVALRNGMWGIMVKDDRMILLVDFERLLRDKMVVNEYDKR